MAERTWRAVEEAAGSGADVLLSSELFGRIDEESIRALDEAARGAGRTLKVLLYLRHPLALASTGAQQQIKQGKKSLADVLANPPVRANAAYTRRFIDVLGRDRINARVFEHVVRTGPLRDLLEQIGYRGELTNLPHLQANASLSMVGTILADAYWSTREPGAVATPPDFLGTIDGPSFVLPASAIDRRHRIDEKIAFIRDELGLVPPPPPERSDAPFTAARPGGRERHSGCVRPDFTSDERSTTRVANLMSGMGARVRSAVARVKPNRNPP